MRFLCIILLLEPYKMLGHFHDIYISILRDFHSLQNLDTRNEEALDVGLLLAGTSTVLFALILRQRSQITHLHNYNTDN
jgi:hypothetical protein